MPWYLPPFPVGGGGAVVTNDWCINDYMAKQPYTNIVQNAFRIFVDCQLIFFEVLFKRCKGGRHATFLFVATDYGRIFLVIFTAMQGQK